MKNCSPYLIWSAIMDAVRFMCVVGRGCLSSYRQHIYNEIHTFVTRFHLFRGSIPSKLECGLPERAGERLFKQEHIFSTLQYRRRCGSRLLRGHSFSEHEPWMHAPACPKQTAHHRIYSLCDCVTYLRATTTQLHRPILKASVALFFACVTSCTDWFCMYHLHNVLCFAILSVASRLGSVSHNTIISF